MCVNLHIIIVSFLIFQMVPLMVLELLGDFPGVPGLFMACVFSASLRYTYPYQEETNNKYYCGYKCIF